MDLTKAEKIRDGLNILLEHGGEVETAAEHDIFYAGFREGKKIPSEIKEHLKALDWFWEEGGWAIFT